MAVGHAVAGNGGDPMMHEDLYGLRLSTTEEAA
jgi:hypothetical protein